MNLEDLKNNLIRSAQEKLKNHHLLGKDSGLSIFEVAQLKDIVAGNIKEALQSKAKFFGLHSLN